MRAIFLRCVKVPQFQLFPWCTNLAAIFCTRSSAFMFPSCKDRSTPPRIQKSNALVMCRLNF
jgi:hypothetical protein